MANVFDKNVSFNILYETVDGVKKPRIDKPDFAAGGLNLHLDVRKVENAEFFAVYMDLNEASKKTMTPGFEIELKEVRVDYTLIGGAKGTATSGPIYLRDDTVKLFAFKVMEHCDVKLVMTIFNGCPCHFVDAKAAKEKLSDCKIVLEDDEEKEVFVHKNILAMSSPFFRTLFYGDFKEKGEDVVRLSGVKQMDFVEYLCCIYPMTSRPFTFKKLDALLVLADRFQNDELISSVESFLMEMKDKSSKEKQQVLLWANAYNIKKLFSATLKMMNKEELKVLDMKVCKKFKEDNIELLMTYIIRQL